NVTGVQTCALPISPPRTTAPAPTADAEMLPGDPASTDLIPSPSADRFIVAAEPPAAVSPAASYSALLSYGLLESYFITHCSYCYGNASVVKYVKFNAHFSTVTDSDGTRIKSSGANTPNETVSMSCDEVITYPTP